MTKALRENRNTLRTQLGGSGERGLFVIGLSTALAMLVVTMLPMALGQLHAFDGLSRYHIPMRTF